MGRRRSQRHHRRTLLRTQRRLRGMPLADEQVHFQIHGPRLLVHHLRPQADVHAPRDQPAALLTGAPLGLAPPTLPPQVQVQRATARPILPDPRVEPVAVTQCALPPAPAARPAPGSCLPPSTP